MKALITGATGFTGGHLARTLAMHGLAVRAIIRHQSSTQALEEMGVECMIGDLRNASQVDHAVKGVDVVYHIAAAYREAKFPESYYHDVNVLGTKNILESACRYHVSRVVHCSTVGVHGHIDNPPADENAPFHPDDIYQRSKLEAEKLASNCFQKGLPGVIFRPVGIYGPGDTRFLKLFKAVRERRFVMFGHGGVFYHLTYIDDLVRGIILCGSKEEALGQVYILGGDEYVPLNELVRRIALAVGVHPPKWRLPLWPLITAAYACELTCRPFGIEPPLYRRRADFFVKDRAFDISKAKKELGYCPQVDMMTGLRQTAEWYVRNGLMRQASA